MLKEEILDRYNFRCVHRHNGLPGGHPLCYDKERKKEERIGFLDIESGGSLDAEWGFVICYRIKPLGGDIIGATIRPSEVRASLMAGGTKDKRILEQFCKDVWKFDTLVVYYGKDSGYRQRHDIPFLRTRCAKWGVEGFPQWRQIKVVDLYDIVRGKFKLAKRRMKDACALFGIESKASPFVTDIWQDALTGWPDAIKYIEKHNIEDVISTEALYKKIIGYKETRTKV
jgi:uncharacterized protein YprB with RNaseH-like and TPR domain